MGWILTLFDLPVMTPEQRKEASRFRKKLMDEGFVMIQYSVYARPCTTHEIMEKEIKRVATLTPKTGNVRIVFITDHQWGKILSIHNPEYNQHRESPDMPDQIEFW